MLGINNERSPVSPISVTSNLSEVVKINNKRIFNTWFETWLVNHVPVLMYHPRWFYSHHNIKVCETVLFIKHESAIASKHQYGMIHIVLSSRAGTIWKVFVKHRNEPENVARFTTSAVQTLVLIHPVDELNQMKELGKMATVASMKQNLNNKY